MKLVGRTRRRHHARGFRPGVWTSALVFISASAPAWAQLPQARLFTIFPPGGRAGTQLEATVSGADLEDATELRFSHAGIHAKGSKQDSFAIAIESNVPPGVYDVRVVGRYGISNPRCFVVGDLPERVDASPQHAATEAASLPLDITLNARASAAADDWFAFVASRNHRILIECAAHDIDSRMDAVVTLYDSDGRELAHARGMGFIDFRAAADGRYLIKVHDLLYRGGAEYFYRLRAGTGPRLDYVFPPAAVPGARARFTLYGRNLPGGTDAGLLAADGKPLEKLDVEVDLPTIASTFEGPATSGSLPPLPPGEGWGEGKLREIFFGFPSPWPSPGGREENTCFQSVVSYSNNRVGPLATPISASIEGVQYRLRSDHGTSNAVPITFASAPIVLESDGPQTVRPPCEIVGRLYPSGHRAVFDFEAKKGSVYRIEVLCQRLGLAADPFLLIGRVTKDRAGREQLASVQEVYANEIDLAGPDFPTKTRDPSVRFQANEDGIFRVQLRDLFNESRADPAMAYRLAIRPEQPGFRLVAMPDAPPQLRPDAKAVPMWSTLLRKGGSAPVKLLALREDGFNGDIDVHVEGLPAGVSAPHVHIPANVNTASVTLTTDENAAAWVGPIRFVGQSIGTGSSIVGSALAGTVVWSPVDGGTPSPAQSRISSEFMIAVSGSEADPLAIRIDEKLALKAAPSGRIQIPFKVIRRGDFKNAMKLRVYGLPGNVPPRETDLAPNASDGTFDLVLAPYRLPPGVYTISLLGLTQGKYTHQKDGKPADVTGAFYSNSIAVTVMPK